MQAPPPAAGDRRALIADSALAVLEAEGGRGLTHRAVDRRAGLPEGSTSNYYKTREALLNGALQRLVEHERPAVEAMKELVPGGPYTPRQAAELIVPVVLSPWFKPEMSGLGVARYELVLEARRRPKFQLALNAVRRDYLALAEQLLPLVGCRRPHEHAQRLLAVLDGLMVNQLFEPVSALTEDALVDLLELQLSCC